MISLAIVYLLIQNRTKKFDTFCIYLQNLFSIKLWFLYILLHHVILPGTARYERYNDTIVMDSTLKYVKQTDHNTTEHRCWSELITNNSNALAFASVYYENNGTCVTYYLATLIWYPVRVEMVNQSQAVSFVKSTGHEGNNTIT